LSVEELLEIFKQQIYPTLIKSASQEKILNLIRDAIKNGRLERGQELRPALELAREVKKLYWEYSVAICSDEYAKADKLESKLQELDEELNNLKPL
jgi:hypothetical protein